MQSAAEQAPTHQGAPAGGLTSHPGSLRPTEIPEGPLFLDLGLMRNPDDVPLPDTGAIRIRGKGNRERTVYVLPGWAAAPPPRTAKELGGPEESVGLAYTQPDTVD